MKDLRDPAARAAIRVRPRRGTPRPRRPPTIRRCRRRAIGVVLANLGTPDATDYWSMRRYLSEFLSDRRVIDYPAWKWQPLLQAMILTKRPFTSGANYRKIWNTERNESPLLTITRDAGGGRRGGAGRAPRRPGDRRFRDALRQSVDRVGDRTAAGRGLRAHPLLPALSAVLGADDGDGERPGLPGADGAALAAGDPDGARLPRPSALHRGAGAVGRGGLRRARPAARPARHQLPRDAGALPGARATPTTASAAKTTRLLRERLGWPKEEVVVSFQSTFGPEEWLKPYTVEEVARLAQRRASALAVIAPAFSSDCVETLEEIQGEIRESFDARGRRGLHLHPLPQRRARAHRHDGRDHRARAGRLGLSPGGLDQTSWRWRRRGAGRAAPGWPSARSAGRGRSSARR